MSSAARARPRVYDHVWHADFDGETLTLWDLLDRGDFSGAAQRLVDGDVISAELVDDEQMQQVQAYLPTTLRLDREGGILGGSGEIEGGWYHVRREFPAQDGPS